MAQFLARPKCCICRASLGRPEEFSSHIREKHPEWEEQLCDDEEDAPLAAREEVASPGEKATPPTEKSTPPAEAVPEQIHGN